MGKTGISAVNELLVQIKNVRKEGQSVKALYDLNILNGKLTDLENFLLKSSKEK